MITEQDLQAAIAECQGVRKPDANTCIKLAAFYTIKHYMFGKAEPAVTYSYAPAPDGAIMIDSDSEFAKAINGRQQSEIWPIMDELMATLEAMVPRLYNGVMKKLY